MKANITLSQLYWNKSLMDFFFRQQSQNTLDDLLNEIEESKSEAIDIIENVVENEFDGDDLDLLEETLYVSTVPELCDIFGLTLKDNEDEDEE